MKWPSSARTYAVRRRSIERLMFQYMYVSYSIAEAASFILLLLPCFRFASMVHFRLRTTRQTKVQRGKVYRASWPYG